MTTYLKTKRLDVLLFFKNKEDVTSHDEVNRQWDSKYKDVVLLIINFANSISSLESLTGEVRTSLNNVVIQVLSVDSNNIAKVILHGKKEPWDVKIKRIVNISDLSDTITGYMDYDELLKNTSVVDEKYLTYPVIKRIVNIAKTLNSNNQIYFNFKTGELLWLNHDDSFIDEHIVVRMFSNIPEIKIITVNEDPPPTNNDFTEVEYMEYM